MDTSSPFGESQASSMKNRQRSQNLQFFSSTAYSIQLIAGSLTGLKSHQLLWPQELDTMCGSETPVVTLTVGQILDTTQTTMKRNSGLSRGMRWESTTSPHLLTISEARLEIKRSPTLVTHRVPLKCLSALGRWKLATSLISYRSLWLLVR